MPFFGPLPSAVIYFPGIKPLNVNDAKMDRLITSCYFQDSIRSLQCNPKGVVGYHVLTPVSSRCCLPSPNRAGQPAVSPTSPEAPARFRPDSLHRCMLHV